MTDDVLDGEQQRIRSLFETESFHRRESGEGTPRKGESIALPRPGARFGRFEIVRVLGAGGMGEVFLARDPMLARNVALKVLRASSILSTTAQERFMREARAAARLQHPRIVAVHEIGKEGDLDFIVMDLIEHQTLAESLQDGALPLDRSLELVCDLAGALHHAHERGILHRDVKPGNILLDAPGRPHLADFGLAAAVEGDPGLTGTGEIIGTPAYLSPEQARGEGATVQTDVYSLGAVLYECLTGMRPYVGGTGLHLIYRIADERVSPPRPRNLDPKILPEVEAICLRCLEYDPALRYRSAGEVVEEIGRLRRGEPILACSSNWFYRMRKWVNRHGVYILLAAITVIVLQVVRVRQTRNEVAHHLRLNEASTWASLILREIEGENDRALVGFGSAEGAAVEEALQGIETHLKVLGQGRIRQRLEGEIASFDLSPVERNRIVDQVLVHYDEAACRARFGWVRSKLLVISGKGREAQLALARALGEVVKGPPAAGLLHDLVAFLLLQGKRTRARRLLETCLPLEDVPPAWQKRLDGLLDDLRGDPSEERRPVISIRRERAPLAPRARQLRAGILLRLSGFPEEAIPLLEGLVERSDWGELGDRALAEWMLSLVDLDRLEEADRLCQRRAGRSGPLGQWILQEQARIRICLEDFSGAAECFRRAGRLVFDGAGQEEFLARARGCDQMTNLVVQSLSQTGFLDLPAGSFVFRCLSPAGAPPSRIDALVLRRVADRKAVLVIRLGEGVCNVRLEAGGAPCTLRAETQKPVRIHLYHLAGNEGFVLSIRESESNRVLARTHRPGRLQWSPGRHRLERNSEVDWPLLEFGTSP